MLSDDLEKDLERDLVGRQVFPVGWLVQLMVSLWFLPLSFKFMNQDI